MTNTALISIIVPVYNTEKYIGKCLDSLINQTYQNIEIICINDGSTDGSKKILEEYTKKDKRIKLINNINSGPAISRNLGLDNSNGEYIMFCDSDDSYKPQMCEKLHKAITENDVDFATCQAGIEYEKGINRAFCANTLTKKMPTGLQYLCNIKISNLSILLWHIIYKKSIIDKYNIRFPDGLESDDVLFNYQYFCATQKYYGILEELYNYVVRENSIMDNYYKRINKSKLYDRIKIFKNLYQFLEKNKLTKTKKEYFLRLLLQQYKSARNILISNDEQEGLRQEIINLVDNIEIYPNSIFDLLKRYSIEEVEKMTQDKTYIELIYGKISIKNRLKIWHKLLTQYKMFYRI